MTEDALRLFTRDPIQAFFLVAENARVIDISHSGCSIETTVPLIMGKPYCFHFLSAGHSTVVEGLVVRCSLTEVTEMSTGGHETFYSSGISFLFQRSPAENEIHQLVRENTAGERRRIGNRIHPILGILVNIGRGGIPKVTDMQIDQIELETELVLEEGAKWDLLVRLNEECFPLSGELRRISQKEGEKNFTVGLLIDDLNLEKRVIISNYLRKIPSKTRFEL